MVQIVDVLLDTEQHIEVPLEYYKCDQIHVYQYPNYDKRDDYYMDVEFEKSVLKHRT